MGLCYGSPNKHTKDYKVNSLISGAQPSFPLPYFVSAISLSDLPFIFLGRAVNYRTNADFFAMLTPC